MDEDLGPYLKKNKINLDPRNISLNLVGVETYNTYNSSEPVLKIGMLDADYFVEGLGRIEAADWIMEGYLTQQELKGFTRYICDEYIWAGHIENNVAEGEGWTWYPDGSYYEGNFVGDMADG